MCESLTEKIKFSGTSVQWQNSDLAARRRVVKKSPWHGRCKHMAAGHPLAGVGGVEPKTCSFVSLPVLSQI